MCKPYTEITVPLQTCTMSWYCTLILHLDIMQLLKLRRGHEPEQLLKAQFSPDGMAGIASWVMLVVSTLCLGPPSTFCSSPHVGIVLLPCGGLFSYSLWNWHQCSYTLYKNKNLPLQSNQDKQDPMDAPKSMVFYKPTIPYLKFFFKKLPFLLLLLTSLEMQTKVKG